MLQDAELFSFVFQNFCEHSGLESKSLSKNLGKSIQQNILWIALEMSLNYDLWIGLRLCKKLKFFPVLWEDCTTFLLDFLQVNLVLPPSELLRYRTLFLKSKSCIICYLKISWFGQVTGVPFPFESWKPLHWEEEAQRNNFLPNSY